MKRLSVFLFAIAALAIAGEAELGNASANTSFDGAWSVVVMTDRGDCEPANHLRVDIRDGALQYAGDSGVSISGQVVSNGQVRVRLENGKKSGTGYGHLSTSSGAGTWRGQGLASSCVGRWSAQRR
jgi:hypothetical protein